MESTIGNHRPDVNHNTMLSKQDISKYLVQTLDEYGYSEKRVKERKWRADKWSAAKTLSTRDIVSSNEIDKFFVGSLAEGISLSVESDTDCMQVNNSVICTDTLKNMKCARNGRVIFRLDRHKAPAGYTYLRCNVQDQNAHPYFDSLQHALMKTPRGSFLSSTKYMGVNEDVFYKSLGYIARNTVYKERQGPSIPKFVKEYGFIERIWDQYGVCRDIDFVRGFQCFCPSTLNNWFHRRRFSTWPSEETQAKIKSLPYYVVPVGLAGSEHEDLEWRISFTLAEICLVRSFNETQRKMHILLRLLVRHVLKPVAPDITSYMMKNIAFWMAERTQPCKFTKDQLFDRVMDAIDYLLTCVKNKRLPNYMIPERNLFHGKFQGKQRRRLVLKLQELHEEGQSILSDMLQSQQIENCPDIIKVLENANFINYVDKMCTLCTFPVSIPALSQYFTFCFSCRYEMFIRFYSLFFIWKHCFSKYGPKLFSDPMEIDLTKELNERETIWHTRRIIARNKANNMVLYKYEPCGWVKSKFLQIFA